LSWGVEAWDLYFKNIHPQNFTPTRAFAFQKTEIRGGEDGLKKIDLKSSGDNKGMLEIRAWM
jgi:hypothetical protein